VQIERHFERKSREKEHKSDQPFRPKAKMVTEKDSQTTLQQQQNNGIFQHNVMI